MVQGCFYFWNGACTVFFLKQGIWSSKFEIVFMYLCLLRFYLFIYAYYYYYFFYIYIVVCDMYIISIQYIQRCIFFFLYIYNCVLYVL